MERRAKTRSIHGFLHLSSKPENRSSPALVAAKAVIESPKTTRASHSDAFEEMHVRLRYQRSLSVADVATDAIWASASRPIAWALTASPTTVVVRELETLAPKPGSEYTVLLLQVVDHILLLAVDPASHNEQ